MGLKVGFLSNGFLLAMLPYTPDLWSAWDLVVTCTQWPVFAIKVCNSFKVSIGLLEASLISLLLAWSSSLEGRPDLYRVPVVGTICLPVLYDCLDCAQRDIQGLWNIFLTHPLICAFPQLYPGGLFKAPWCSCVIFLWNALPRRGNLQEQLILFWNDQNHNNLTQVEAN